MKCVSGGGEGERMELWWVVRYISGSPPHPGRHSGWEWFVTTTIDFLPQQIHLTVKLTVKTLGDNCGQVRLGRTL